MGSFDLLGYIGDADSKDLFQVLKAMNGVLADAAESIGLPTFVLFAVGLAAATVAGFFGYKLIKLLMGVCLGGVGYFVGVALFELWGETAEWLPEWGCYICGAVFAVAFFCLAFAKFSYVVYSAFALAGYCTVMFYFENAVLAVGFAIVLAMVSVSWIRTAFVLASSFVSGVLCVAFLSELLPKVELLQLGEGAWFALCLGVALAALFAVVQFVTNRHVGEETEG